MRKTMAMLVAALALAGCGGGGGGGGNTRADPPPVARVPEAPETSPVRVPEPEPEPEPDPPPPPPLPERSSPRIPGPGDYAPVVGAAAFRADPEYQGLDSEGTGRSWAIDGVRAADAYARLAGGVAPGAGIRIAVVDDGVDVLHPELSPAYIDSSRTWIRTGIGVTASSRQRTGKG